MTKPQLAELGKLSPAPKCKETWVVDTLIDSLEKKAESTSMGAGVFKKTGNLKKADIIKIIQSQIGRAIETCTITYVGHGAKSGNIPTHDDQAVTLKDVVDLIPATYEGKTTIELDCCFAGQWIEQAKALDKSGGFGEKKVKIMALAPKDKPLDWRSPGAPAKPLPWQTKKF